jgi:uncharacterized protein DUF6968
LRTPVQVAESEWCCAFHVTGMRKPARAFGADAFQALTLALEGIRAHLEQSEGRYTWEGGEAGDPGFPQVVPGNFGLKFSTRVAGLIERELRSCVKERKRRSR